MTGKRTLEIAAVLVVVAAFPAYFLNVISDESRDLTIMLAIVATLWSAAVVVLVRHWRRSTGARLSTMDRPGRLLATSVAALPEHRRDWGTAMLAELPEVQGTWRRWRFAFSCLRVALVSPPAAGWPLTAVVVLLAGTAVAGARQVTVSAVPAMEVFAVTLAVLTGVLAIAAAARTRRFRLRAPAPAAILVGAVVAAVAALAMFLRHYPAAAEFLPPASAVVLAVVLAAGLGLALAPPPSLSGGLLAPHLGIFAALIFCTPLALVMRYEEGTFVALFLILLGLPVLGAPGLIVAAVTRSLRAGIHAVAWAILPAAILIYAAWLPGVTRANDVRGRVLYDGEGRPIGDNLNDSMFLAFFVMPLVAIPIGVLAAGFGAWVRRKMSQYSNRGGHA